MTAAAAGHATGVAAGSVAPATAKTDTTRTRFPPRPAMRTWANSALSLPRLVDLLARPPFAADTSAGEFNRRRGVRIVLEWLETVPGASWQQRWLASGAEDPGVRDWRMLPSQWHQTTTSWGCRTDSQVLGTGLLSLMCADVIRPGPAWLLRTATPKRLAAEMARTRDPAGFGDLLGRCDANPVGESTTGVALHRIAVVMATKGGMVGDITVGDCLELLDVAAVVCKIAHYKSPYFYQLLHAVGVFGDRAASTVAELGARRQRGVDELIDRCGIECRPVRDLLVDYLRERQVSVDHVSLVHLADALGRLFWRDLERHHPGIDSLRLAPSVAAEWKQRVAIKTTRRKQSDGAVVEIHSPRESAANCLMVVRGFYLDIAQWAADDPTRWGRWAVPCPIKAGEVPHRKVAARRKSRMDQRTRDRLPVLPVLVAAVAAERVAAAERLVVAQATAAGETFSVRGRSFRRVATTRAQVANVWVDDPDGGPRTNLTRAERRAFWVWAAVEVLRHTGIRVEELTELTQPSLVSYRLPSTGEVVPLLHIAPSKSDAERLLVISPELADVLSAIVGRVRGDTGTVPAVAAYDYHERVFNPPLPILFQHPVGTENRAINAPAIRVLLDEALAATGLTEPDGRRLRFVPHDFRRIFITDAVMNGMPPHIAQLVAGHQSITTTIGYKAVFPEETINGHRAFLARRRALRPSEEYRTPTDEEWESFLGHFERRKLSLGTCARAYATTCVHEHSCIRCPLLRPDPAQRPRLAAIRVNLLARIDEARREGWAGETEGLAVSLAGADQKLAQIDAITRRTTATPDDSAQPVAANSKEQPS